MGLLAGLVIAVIGYAFKSSLFGSLHFLLIVPILFVCSALVTYFLSLCSPAPAPEKLETTTFNAAELKAEVQRAFRLTWYKNYFIYALTLVTACVLVYIILG